MTSQAPSVVASSPEPRRHRPLRVLYVAHTMVPGGSASSLQLLIANMPPGVAEAHLLAPNGGARADFEALGLTLHSIPGVASLDNVAGAPLRGMRLLTVLRALWNARHVGVLTRALEEVRPDIVHINDRGMLQAACVAHRAGYPVVMHARSVNDRNTRWLNRLYGRVYTRCVDRLIAIDHSVRDSLREIARCDVVYNPLRRIPSAARSPGESTDGDRRTVRFTFLSGLLPVKGVWDLLHAAKRLAGRPDILFQIAGANPRPRAFYESFVGKVSRLVGLSRDLEREVARWVAEHGLTDSVTLLGHVNSHELLAGTDVLLFPSRLNGPGRSVFEAGAIGIPSIVSLRDRVEDIVVHRETGLIVPEGDPAALAAAIVELADDPALRQRLGRNARERYLEQFDAPSSSRQVLKIYDEVLGERARNSQR